MNASAPTSAAATARRIKHHPIEGTGLRRKHVRIVQAEGNSVPMSELYPPHRSGDTATRSPQPPDAGLPQHPR